MSNNRLYKEDHKNIVHNIFDLKKYNELNDILWKYYSKDKLEKKHTQNITIGLFNVPCGGFGDIIVTKTFHDYIKEWYPSANVYICTTGPEKYKQLGIKDKMIQLTRKDGNTYDNAECSSYDTLKISGKIKFDIMVVIPIINYVFNLNQFKKLISYANIFNTFSVSEYNGEFPPYTFPIGVGDNNLGIFFNDFKIKQQTLIKKPYAMVYIQPSPSWGPHSNSCFLSFLEMICKNYHKKHPKFQIVIPSWISDEFNTNNTFYYHMIKIVRDYYSNISIIDSDKEKIDFVSNDNQSSSLTFRSDILPQKREIFISIMKDSVKDILVTGDQSITDILSCCKSFKRVWYQIAPWKSGFAENLQKHLPNKYFSSFRSTCGTIKSIDLDIDWKNFMKKYDFRINGRKRFDSILISIYHLHNDKKLKQILKMIESSRKLSVVKNKVRNFTIKKIKRTKRTKRNKKKSFRNKI